MTKLELCNVTKLLPGCTPYYDLTGKYFGYKIPISPRRKRVFWIRQTKVFATEVYIKRNGKVVDTYNELREEE